jgi:hypothetical protein
MSDESQYHTAFPALKEHGLNYGCPGMTLREYAAIHLRVPDSGSDWLDKMIEQRLRDEVAAKVMHGTLFHIKPVLEQDEMRGLANMSYYIADVILKARGTA